MITNLTITNFRSIRETTLELGRFTVLNGANNSGKSSVLYALQVLKNVVTNPNQTIDEFFNLGFLNLGGLEGACYAQFENTKIEIAITVESRSDASSKSAFSVVLSDQGNQLILKGIKPFQFEGILNVSFPYTLNKKIIIEDDNQKINFDWNGISSNSISGSEFSSESLDLVVELQLPIICINNLDVTPTNRGFSRPIYNQVPLESVIISQDEVASLLQKDKILQSKVKHYFKKITGLELAVSKQKDAGFFYLQINNPNLDYKTELVNQGMGINQIVFLLAKILYDKNSLICIDEPEIHLHPTLIEQFVKTLVEIAKQENKQFLFSTHSEHWLMSLLAEVYEQQLTAEELKVYFLQKHGIETVVEQQQVMPNGQIKGGLKNFLEAQMNLANRFFPAEITT